MAEQLKLKTENKLSYFNREALIGAVIGLLLPVPVPVGGDWASSLAGTLIGGLIGAFAGMYRLQKENRDGKSVGTASFWNAETLIGGVLGNNFGALMGMTAAMAIAMAGLAHAGADISASAILTNDAVSQQMATLLVEHAPVYAVATTGVFLTSWFGGVAVGSYVGGKAGEKRQMAEYNLAMSQQTALQQGRSLQVAQSVEYAVEHSKNWGKSVQDKPQDINKDNGRV